MDHLLIRILHQHPCAETTLEGQQKLTMDLDGKIDDIYTNLNDKFEALITHVKKLETHVV